MLCHHAWVFRLNQAFSSAVNIRIKAHNRIRLRASNQYMEFCMGQLLEKRMARAVGMASQGAWMKWESAVPRKITWKTLWKMEPIRIQFTIRSTYDLLPTPTNLMRWGMSDDAKCGLCSEPCHLEHILSSCKIALRQRRFTWRHDTALRELVQQVRAQEGSCKEKQNQSNAERGCEVR